MDNDFLEKYELEEKESLARGMNEEYGGSSSFLGMRKGSGDSDDYLRASSSEIWMKRKKKKKEGGLKDFYKF